MPFITARLPSQTQSSATSSLLLALPLLAACGAPSAASDSPVEGEDTQLSSSDLPSFEAFGALDARETYVTAMSATGSVVVGFAVGAAQDEAFRWTEQAGLETLEGAGGRAQAVSQDGSLIAGSVVGGSAGDARAAVLWRSPEAFQLLVGPSVPDGGPPIFSVVEGQAILEDGRVFGTCLQHAAYGEPLACRYDGAGEVATFGLGHIYAADAAGNHAGTRQSERHAPFMTVATFNGEALPFPADVECGPITGCQAAAYDFSEGGALVVGGALLPTTSAEAAQVGFVHSAGEGTLRLPDLAGGEQASGAYAVTPDGRVIAGFGSDTTGRAALVWVERVPRALEELVAEAGAALPEGFRLLDVRAVSDDGRVFAGNGRNAEGKAEGYRVALAEAP